FGPRGGIFGCKFVHNLIVGVAREALHQMQLLPGPFESASGSEIGRVDHERIALPMAVRVSLPLTDVLRDVRATVCGNDACGMVNLVKEGHVSRALHNLEQVTLAGRGKHGDHLLSHEDATL